MFTRDSFFFLRSNNDPRIHSTLFVSNQKLFVCGGVSVFEKLDSFYKGSEATNDQNDSNLLNTVFKEKLSNCVEVFDFGLQDWMFHSKALPFKAHSMKSLVFSSGETILYGGFVKKTSNRFLVNTKLVLFDSKSESFTEWIDLALLSKEESEILDILVQKDLDSTRLFVMLTYNHSDSAFELEFDFFVLDVASLSVHRIPSFSRFFLDEFGKKVIKPVSIQQQAENLLFTCQHLYVQTCLFQTLIPLELLLSNASLEKPLELLSIHCNSSLGPSPIFLEKSNKNISYLFPLALANINRSIKASPDLLTIKEGHLFIYTFELNKMLRRKIPDLISPFMNQCKSVFINDDLVFICGGYFIMKSAKNISRKPSKMCFLYSIKEDKWVVPLSIKSGQKTEEKELSNVKFVNSNLLTMNSPKIHHNLIIFKKSSKF